MGAQQSKAETTKYSTRDQDNRIYYGASCMQGWRPYMEDFHTAILKMPNIAFPHYCPHPYVATYSNFPKEAAKLIHEYLEASNVDISSDEDGPSLANGSAANGTHPLSANPAAGHDNPDAKPDPHDHGENHLTPLMVKKMPSSGASINSTLDIEIGSIDSIPSDGPPRAVARIRSTYADPVKGLGMSLDPKPSTLDGQPLTTPGPRPKPARASTQITIPTHPTDNPALKNVHPPPYVFSSLLFPSEHHYSFFSVCDGHRGNRVSHFISRRIHWRIASTNEFERGEFAEAMRKGYVGLDEELKHAYDTVLAGREPAGSTCVTALVTDDQQLYVANTGDSRAVLCSGGEVVPMSFDHKPDGETERERIETAGGHVDDGRVMGRLATARAIGDFDFKRDPGLRLEDQMVTAKPDVYHKTLTDFDEFLVMCSDGVFDVLTSASLISFIRSRIASGSHPHAIAEEVLDYCLATNPSAGDVENGAAAGTDNMTCLIVVFLRGRTWDEFVELIRDRYGGVGEAGPDDVVEVDLSALGGAPRPASRASRSAPPPIANPKKRYEERGGVEDGGLQCCGGVPAPAPAGGGDATPAAPSRTPSLSTSRAESLVSKMEERGNLVIGEIEEVELALRQEAPTAHS